MRRITRYRCNTNNENRSMCLFLYEADTSVFGKSSWDAGKLMNFQAGLNLLTAYSLSTSNIIQASHTLSHRKMQLKI
jgi:hypothetical protein